MASSIHLLKQQHNETRSNCNYCIFFFPILQSLNIVEICGILNKKATLNRLLAVFKHVGDGN